MSFKPNVGDVFLNKYEIVSLVGEGAFGSVYRAKDIKLDRIVAIKFLEAVNNLLSRFQDEIDAIKSLDHPNIVRLYDFDILKGGIPVMVMEFVNGRELGDILNEDGPFDLIRICEIAVQVLDALVETHKHNIIHCDLKPENIMLTSLGARRDVAKLIDFGVASLLSKSDDARKNMLVGTPQYMAPEQILHKPLGPWTDIYAIGLILIELFTGEFVFDHEDPMEVLKMQVREPVKMPDALANSELGPIIAKAVEKDVSRRYQSTQAFYDDISEALQTIRTASHQKNKRPLDAPAASLASLAGRSLLTDIDDLTGSHDAPAHKPSIHRRSSSFIPKNKPQLGTFHVELGDLNSAISSAKSDLPISGLVTPAQPPKTDAPASQKSTTSVPKAEPIKSDPALTARTVSGSFAQPASNLNSRTVSGSFAQPTIKSSDPATRPTKLPPKDHHLLIIIIAAIIFLTISGGGFYAWKTGMLEASPVVPEQVKDMLQTDEPDLPPSQAADEPAPQPKPIVRFTTLREAAKTMAYVAAISGQLGKSKTARKYKTFRVIGTPVTAKIYVNNSLTCSRSPCNIHIFGDIKDMLIELREGTAVSRADVSALDPKKPIILSLGQ